ncbi:Adenosylcobinamide-phosphate synthase [Devosia sp. DBB001]|nr:Adenosylcobinamide-phosphate synthase [Devosia sp. DBB001]
MHPLLAPLAFLLERFLGYPNVLLDSVGHPVMWFGRLIDSLEVRLNKPERTDTERQQAGIVALIALLAATLVVTLIIVRFLALLEYGWVVEALLAVPFLAQKQLGEMVKAVADALGVSLEAGREAVSHIVGRDTRGLDESGVSRAAVESLAENASDGVIAPLFWLVLFGLPGIALYKAINTADSMIGHMDERYRDYGWASAKLDDLVNWIPARLTAVLITAGCFFVPGASPSSAWKATRHDAGGHKSPNAGWPEAAMAGALGFALGGPRDYDGETVDLPTMGDGRRQLRASDVLRSVALYKAMLNVTLALVIVIALLRMAGHF